MSIGTELDEIFDPTFFPATKDELIDMAVRYGASKLLLDHLEKLESDYDYRNIFDITDLDDDLGEFFNHDEE